MKDEDQIVTDFGKKKEAWCFVILLGFNPYRAKSESNIILNCFRNAHFVLE